MFEINLMQIKHKNIFLRLINYLLLFLLLILQAVFIIGTLYFIWMPILTFAAYRIHKKTGKKHIKIGFFKANFN